MASPLALPQAPASRWRARELVRWPWSSVPPSWPVPVLGTLLLLLLTVSPVLAVLVASFRPQGLPLSAGWTVGHYVDVWTSAATYLALLQTLLFALASAGFGIVMSG